MGDIRADGNAENRASYLTLLPPSASEDTPIGDCGNSICAQGPQQRIKQPQPSNSVAFCRQSEIIYNTNNYETTELNGDCKNQATFSANDYQVR